MTRVAYPERQFWQAAVVFSLLAGVSTVSAQQPPSLGYAYPPAVSSGSTTQVALGGYDFTPDMQFFAPDDRVTLTPEGDPGEFFVSPPPYWFGPRGFSSAMKIPREIPVQIHVASDCPPGLRRWQVANAGGAAAAAVILVSDRPETVEDRYRDNPQTIKHLPAGVSGRLSRIAEVDRYEIRPEKDGPHTVELFARRLGAGLNGLLQIIDEGGNVLIDRADTLGNDLAVTFDAKAGARYTIRLHDVDFRGHRSFIYRLAITPGPRVITTIPGAARRGQTQQLEFVGVGVATGIAHLESVTREVVIPAEPEARFFRYQLETPHGNAPAYEIPLSDLVEHKDVANISPASAVTLRLTKPAGTAIRFAAQKGQPLRIDATSRAIGTNLDLSLSIRDATGKQLARNDDLPGTTDAGLEFIPAVAGEFSCVIEDVSGQPLNAASVFRLSLRPQQPDFELTVPQLLNVPIGGKAQLAVKAVRRAGFKAPISIRMEGLPDGIQVPQDAQIPEGKNDLKLNVEVAAETAARAGAIRIIGEATVGDATLTRVARAPAGGNLVARRPFAETTDRLLLTTTLKAPFSLELIDRNRQRPVHRGTTYPAEFIIQRDEGFQGEVQMMMAATQSRHRQGISGPIIKVPPETDRALYPSFMPEWLATDRTTRMSVLGMAVIADPKGTKRYVAKPSAARITMILEGALLKVSQQAGELTVASGSAFTIPLTVSRSPKLKETVTVTLVIPEELTGALQCPPVMVEPGQSTVPLQVQTLTDQRLS
ncbi:MAG: hypothetical protein VB858_05190, partial [Planctomycetaceae bacterium]